MQPVGIEKINLYAGRFSANAVDLAVAQGRDIEHIQNQVMVKNRSVIPAYEDTVTLAVNAVRRLLTPEEVQSIELLIVATESGVDFGKPVSTWVHRFCGLPENCRSFELKHACYGATAAVKTAAMWLRGGGISPGKKALVIGVDYSRPHVDDRDNFIGGGAAVAMLVSNEPKVLEIDFSQAGIWTHEIPDTFRPTAKIEMGDNQTSLYSYLDALEGAYTHYQSQSGNLDFAATFQKHIYHTPFPGMPAQAHRTLLGLLEIDDPAEIAASYQKNVQPGIVLAQQVGSTYGSSTFLDLLSLINYADDLKGGDQISIFAYGSGCQGEFYSGKVSEGAPESVKALDLDQHINERIQLSVLEYELMECLRDRHIDGASYEPRLDGFNNAYQKCYAGQDLLILRQVKDYYRHYEWS